MRVKFENNTLTVVTNITEATLKKGIADLKVKDDKGNTLYAVGQSQTGALDTFALGYNAIIDGKLAVVKVITPIDATKTDIMKQYGEALLAAEKYTAIIAGVAAEKEAAIEAIFETENGTREA